MLIAVLSLFAGVLTVLAPCVLPFLPVIVGGSLAGGDRRRPWVIALSLVGSLVLFTLLLKVSTALIGIDPMVWTIASGSLVVLLGIAMLLPGVWSCLASWTRLDSGSHALLNRAGRQKTGMASALLTGAALGPVFSSCSPTYAWVIATVLPASPAAGTVYLGLYCVGLAGALLAISLLGRTVISKLSWAADPRGWFQRIIAVLFIVVGLLVATGVDKTVQTWAVERFPALVAFEQQLVPQDEERSDSGAELEAGRPAPEVTGVQTWLNSDPLTLKGLRGKVVLVDFWTYSCINCQRTQPYLNAWYERYYDAGFEIIGVHAPEFAFEKLPANVERAIRDARIAYPVALDNDFATWRAFHNRYWPAKYLIDADGNVRYTHFGEGSYDETENAIRALLGTDGDRSSVTSPPEVASQGQSPETYLGTARARGHVGEPSLHDGITDYREAGTLRPNEWTLQGRWDVGPESITAAGDGARLRYRFNGRRVYLVLGGRPGAAVHVSLEGGPPGGADVRNGVVTVNAPGLSTLVALDEPAEGRELTLTFDAGVTANAFTFG